MEKQIFSCGGRRVALYGKPSPLLLLQPADEREADALEKQLAHMESSRPFALAAFSVRDWNRELSPWAAEPVFGRTPFGGEAEETLGFLTGELLPALREATYLPQGTALCLGGYSLAGLFALWAGTRTDLFAGLAAASPSVWFPGWIDYVSAHPIRAGTVYLSLGEREERTRHPVMRTVADRIRAQYELLSGDHEAVLEWNPGGHFDEPDLRLARAFRWLAERLP